MTTGRGRSLASPNAAAFAPLAELLQGAIASSLIPGAVVAVGRREGAPWIRAFGHRALAPRRERATSRTIYDLASLTKPMATGALAARFAARGLLRYDDPLEAHLAETRGTKVGAIPLAFLLTHTAGFPPDNPIQDYRGAKSALYRSIAHEALEAEPGTRFRYSDVGYVLVQGVLERRAGRRLDRLAEAELFSPLGFRDTRYGILARERARCAPTTFERRRWLRGRVHDPRARALGGIAGHAGLFGTAAEVARFCAMLLAGGTHRGREVLAPPALLALTKNQCPASLGVRRGFGFDIESPYSAPRGSRFSDESYGHSGYTGVSMWIDPGTDAYIVLLTNSVHPDGHKDLKALRADAATLASEALDRAAPRAPRTAARSAPRPQQTR
jgi:CubicO group peptidase (beta-lactamase class C family)